ncbi:MAG: PSD1 and planctomycete cytochrome C domain-containing protein [Bryobacter sp.]
MYRLALFACSALVLLAQRQPLFRDEVQPILAAKCAACHSETQKMAQLDLSSFAGLMTGGANGAVLVPGKPEMSLLWKMVESGKMPMGAKPLSDAEKKILRDYIEQGRFPKLDVSAQEAAREAKIITPEARQWWSFVPPVKSTPPGDGHWVDAFVKAKLAARGWSLQAEAPRATLLRRLSFALTGLAPAPQEVEAFAADRDPEAYTKRVDALLASRHFGEHWGRHWLDLAGYSDTTGDAGDSEREAMYKYRDWVVGAMNRNMPYDAFVRLQLAGDQFVNYKPGTKPNEQEREALLATGYIRSTTDITDNQSIYQVDKYFDAIFRVTDTTMKNLMGLSIGCARCHDHKFDPILQKDYYRLMASFQAVYDPEAWLAGNLAYGPWPSRMVLDMESEVAAKWKEEVSNKDAVALRRARLLLEATYQRYRTALQLGKNIDDPAARETIRKEIEADPDLQLDQDDDGSVFPNSELEARFPELVTIKNEINDKYRKKKTTIKPEYLRAAWDVSKTPSPTYLLMRGDYLSPGPEVKPGVLAVLDSPTNPTVFPDPKAHPEWNHTGRRMALAKWLTRADHPLTARVWVNRVWQYLFGEGLVRSVDDFGHEGTKPTHPELLDTLAVRFVEHGWDTKWLIREILLSETWRQSSAADAEKMKADPENHLLWRKQPLRLEAETIRDTMLQVSGLLQLEAGGPPVGVSKLPDGQFAEDPKKGNVNRRSLYLSYQRTRPVGFLKAFDCPEMTADNQAQRFRSTLPVQALALLNNPLVMRTSNAFAQRVLEEAKGNTEAAVERAFRLAYSRKPEPREIALAQQTIATAHDPAAGLRLFLQAMLAANEFLYAY